MKTHNIEVMLALFIIGLLAVGIEIVPVKAEPSTIYVDDDSINGPWNGTPEYPYQNITSGLSHAASGDTIYVYAGLYIEKPTINMQISLIGQDKRTTTIDGNQTGTVLKITADGVTVAGFTIANGGFPNLASGIFIEGVDSSRISNNTIKYSYRGIRTANSSNNVITSNEISQNMRGMYLVNSNSNRLTDNTIAINHIGLVLENSNNNMIFHNNFKDNVDKSVSLSDSEGNSWDNGIEGNYWDKYLGKDSNRDGVGDTPHQIPSDHQDNYPLMGIHSSLTVHWQSDEYQLSITSNSTISQSRFNEVFMMINLSANGPNGTTGFCRVSIPNLLVNKPHVVTVDGEQTYATTLSASNSTITFLYFTYLQDSRRVNILSKPYFELQELYNILSQEHKNLTSHISELAILLNNLTARLDNMTHLYNNLSDLYKTLETNYTKLQENYNNLTARLDNMTHLYNRVIANYTSLRDDYDSLQISHTLLDDLYRELSNAFAELGTHSSLLQQNYESLQNETNTLREEYWLQNATFSELESEYADLKSSVGNLTVAAVALVSLPSVLAIASFVESRRQKRTIEEYKHRMDQLSPLSVARERFETKDER